MKYSEYSKWSARANVWIQRYFDTLHDRPVRSQIKPGDISNQIPADPPDRPERMDTILSDFERIIPEGMTNWQHPRFFAYFPANAAPASMIADQLVNAIAAQCMLWQTSPAATELETAMIGWLRDAMGLPNGYQGVIQDSASSANLSAVLTMRERSQNFCGNTKGYAGAKPARIYCSDEVHSSIDKAIWIAGIGQENLVKIPTDDTFGMRPEALQAAITQDRANGFNPAGVVLCIGGTGIGASDHLPPLVKIVRKEGLYTHLDAAWAGSAMICPELQPIFQGAGDCDSIVFNPHKWLGAGFDCSVQFLRDPTDQIRTLGIKPSYLQTQGHDEIINYSEWTVPLGRRFRALKLWFLIRAYGLDGLRARIRNHINWAEQLAQTIGNDPDFTITTTPRFSLFSFQYTPKGLDPDTATAQLLEDINNDGRVYLTQTHHQSKFVIRVQVGQFDCTAEDVQLVYNVAKELATGTRR